MSDKLKVCVLGAAGSIGSQLLIDLHERGCLVTAVVRSLSSAVRIGRYPIKIVQADILKLSEVELEGILIGHDALVDCTYSTNMDYQSCIDECIVMANIICAASIKAKVKKIVHYGTISVYPHGALSVSEETQCAPKLDAYADSKLEAENIFLSQLPEKISVSVLQLPIVYGPFMQWSSSAVKSMSNGTLLFPDTVHGHCSPIYIDDVVNASFLALSLKQSHVEKILLTGSDHVSWLDYYKAYANLSPTLKLKVSPREQILAVNDQQKEANRPWNRLKREFSNDGDFRQLILGQWGIRFVYGCVKRRRGQKGVDDIKARLAAQAVGPELEGFVNLSDREIALFDGMPRIQTDKAKRVLGFSGSVSFERGMKRTSAWLEWAGLI